MNVTLITGLPRSGTSLVCACLNTAANCVALVEPMTVPSHGDRARAVEEIVRFCAETRETILRTGTARSAHLDGAIVDDTFQPILSTGGRRRAQTRVGQINVARPLDQDFRLFVKHPAMFSALAAPLSRVLPLFAVVRRPLAVLASWQTVDMPVGSGRAPAAEAFCPRLASELDRAPDVLSRQVALLRWFLQTYAELPPASILTHEAVVADAPLALKALTGGPKTMTHRVETHDLRRRYRGVELRPLAQALLQIETEASLFYPDFSADLAPYLREAGSAF